MWHPCRRGERVPSDSRSGCCPGSTQGASMSASHHCCVLHSSAQLSRSKLPRRILHLLWNWGRLALVIPVPVTWCPWIMPAPLSRPDLSSETRGRSCSNESVDSFAWLHAAAQLQESQKLLSTSVMLSNSVKPNHRGKLRIEHKSVFGCWVTANHGRQAVPRRTSSSNASSTSWVRLER